MFFMSSHVDSLAFIDFHLHPEVNAIYFVVNFQTSLPKTAAVSLYWSQCVWSSCGICLWWKSAAVKMSHCVFCTLSRGTRTLILERNVAVECYFFNTNFILFWTFSRSHTQPHYLFQSWPILCQYLFHCFTIHTSVQLTIHLNLLPLHTVF